MVQWRIFQDISFSLAPGQTLGVLGPTGSGKSTLVSLLLRFYDADKGSIYLNGEKIQSIPYEQLRKKFGVVFQNDFIREGSIESNIRYFREITPEQLSAAARDAQADFIAEKENGMAHDVAVRGNNLSGGQSRGCLLPEPWRLNRKFLCWMTLPVRWTTVPMHPFAGQLRRITAILQR